MANFFKMSCNLSNGLFVKSVSGIFVALRGVTYGRAYARLFSYADLLEGLCKQPANDAAKVCDCPGPLFQQCSSNLPTAC